MSKEEDWWRARLEGGGLWLETIAQADLYSEYCRFISEGEMLGEAKFYLFLLRMLPRGWPKRRQGRVMRPDGQYRSVRTFQLPDRGACVEAWGGDLAVGGGEGLGGGGEDRGFTGLGGEPFPIEDRWGRGRLVHASDCRGTYPWEFLEVGDRVTLRGCPLKHVYASLDAYRAARGRETSLGRNVWYGVVARVRWEIGRVIVERREDRPIGQGRGGAVRFEGEIGARALGERYLELDDGLGHRLSGRGGEPFRIDGAEGVRYVPALGNGGRFPWRVLAVHERMTIYGHTLAVVRSSLAQYRVRQLERDRGWYGVAWQGGKAVMVERGTDRAATRSGGY